jgi:hypothetical protein
MAKKCEEGSFWMCARVLTTPVVGRSRGSSPPTSGRACMTQHANQPSQNRCAQQRARMRTAGRRKDLHCAGNIRAATVEGAGGWCNEQNNQTERDCPNAFFLFAVHMQADTQLDRTKKATNYPTPKPQRSNAIYDWVHDQIVGLPIGGPFAVLKACSMWKAS